MESAAYPAPKPHHPAGHSRPLPPQPHSNTYLPGCVHFCGQ
jgi:hypothetical protein